MSCPVCDGDRLVPFLTRRGVPVHQNLVLQTRDEARAVTRGDLELVACLDCAFVRNAAFDESLLRYGAAYDNDQSCSGMFEGYVEALIQSILADGVRGRRVLEIGCGKGYFLQRLCERGDNEGLGVDATYVGPEQVGRVRFLRRLYDGEVPGFAPDAIVCRHVIEHVPEPRRLLEAACRGAGRRTDVRLYFETPELRWILERRVIQDFFYEHCSYFTASSLALAFRRAGLNPTRVEPVFHGQYLWLVGDTGGAPPPPSPLDTAAWRALLEGYARDEAQARAEALARLESLGREARVAVWGAGAKGVTFVNLVDPQASLVACVVDVNPRKQGRYVPGTGHAIVGPEALGDLGVGHVILMNPNYEQEVRAALEQLGVRAHLHVGGWS